jgi:hypothetical protein
MEGVLIMNARGGLPEHVIQHVRKTEAAAIPSFQASASSVVLTGSIRPHLEPELVQTLVGENYLQSLLREEHYHNLICGLVCMNKTGRAYLKASPGDKEKGIHVLESVSDNIDCLFLHLRENLI